MLIIHKFPALLFTFLKEKILGNFLAWISLRTEQEAKVSWYGLNERCYPKAKVRDKGKEAK